MREKRGEKTEKREGIEMLGGRRKIKEAREGKEEREK